ncbi:hypothetical protein SCLCIDRAFT_125179 [Scleroderma citrinum Foug A]|uniref:Uncharacterized protein n=1 Tax=Scleroderma citrinum Foug A TaxID=1036808 RepID=A0A0C2ZE53_9AGAM|nr:hypothetical protein SCLCIDRAFT_125179 [Scleroderma citrinum Foug A]
MKKPKKQCKPSNTFLQMKSDREWDTAKAQLLEKISQVLRPKLINFDDYIFSWSVPRYQSSQMQLHTNDNYKFLITHALKPKEAAANIRIETKLAKARKGKAKQNDESDAENDASDNPLDSGDSSDTSGDRQHAKKKTKTKGGKKIVKETALNRDADEKIKLLRSRWECSKGGCSTSHCFIHPENSEHIPLSHNHFAIWAAAWSHLFILDQQRGPQFADLEKPLNHAKFNNFRLGQLGETSPLLQQRINERNQQPGQSAPIFNINVPQEVIGIFCPPAAVAANPAPSPLVLDKGLVTLGGMAGDTDPDLLLPGSAAPGPRLTLQQFCGKYSLSDAVYHKLNENGYTSSNTISYIRVSELKEMGFKHSEIAVMKDAVQQWISST